MTTGRRGTSQSASPTPNSDDAEPGETDVAEAAHQHRRGQPADDRADSLERREHADERRRTVQPVGRQREDDRLAEPGDEHHGAHADRQLAQHARPHDVQHTRRDLAQERLARGDGRLDEAKQHERRRRRARSSPRRRARPRRRRTRRRSRRRRAARRAAAPRAATAGSRSPPRAARPGASPSASPSARPRTGRRRGRTAPRRRRSARGRSGRSRTAARQTIAAIARCVTIISRRFGSRSTTRPPSGAASPAEREHEEDEPGGGVRSGQHLRPDGEDEEHRPVAEHRERLARQEEADVAAAEQLAHARLPTPRGRRGSRR